MVDELTSSAVETELGREYVRIRPRWFRGEKGDDVRNRIERWKARVEKVHRITIEEKINVRS